VFPDGSLGPIQKRPKPPRHPQQVSPPTSTISKYEGCSREELLQKIKDVRILKELLEKKKFPVPGQPGVKLPKNENLEFYARVKELASLHRALKKLDGGLDSGAVCQGARGNEDDDHETAGADGNADSSAAVVFSSSDEGGKGDA
jgi:hypothetical protein